MTQGNFSVGKPFGEPIAPPCVLLFFDAEAYKNLASRIIMDP
jgi:hypothetical protein